MRNGIVNMLGLKDLTYEDLKEKAGIERHQLGRVEFKKGGQDGSSSSQSAGKKSGGKSSSKPASKPSDKQGGAKKKPMTPGPGPATPPQINAIQKLVKGKVEGGAKLAGEITEDGSITKRQASELIQGLGEAEGKMTADAWASFLDTITNPAPDKASEPAAEEATTEPADTEPPSDGELGLNE